MPKKTATKDAPFEIKYPALAKLKRQKIIRKKRARAEALSWLGISDERAPQTQKPYPSKKPFKYYGLE